MVIVDTGSRYNNTLSEDYRVEVLGGQNNIQWLLLSVVVFIDVWKQ